MREEIKDFIMRLLVSILVALVCSMDFSFAEVLEGNAVVIDGDTIEIKGERIRLACVDTPESYYKGKVQYCLDNMTNCGFQAKSALMNMIGKDKVTCDCYKRDVYNRLLCFCGPSNATNSYTGNYYYGVNEYNLRLIDEGYAWFYDGGKECRHGFYKEVFELAKHNQMGLFNEDLGGFMEPKKWRKSRSNDANQEKIKILKSK